MLRKRKIAMVVKKLSFKEAEEAEDEYWANTSVEERLQEFMRLRKMVYGDLLNQPMQKVVFKGSVYEIENKNLSR
jgi:hypothetical protein